MQFHRIDADVATCARHLAALEAPDPEVEVFLTRYLLVIAFAEYTERIQEVISVRASRIEDEALAAFIQFAARRLLRSYSLSDLSELLGRFGGTSKDEFTAKVTNTPAHAAYDRIIKDRHGTAHGPGADMTFGDFQQAYAESRAVFEAFAEALGCLEDFR